MNNGPQAEIKMVKMDLPGALNDVQQRDFSLKQVSLTGRPTTLE